MSGAKRTERMQTSIGDFSGIRFSVASFEQATPESEEDVRAIVENALSRKNKLRFRAQGHSLNGASLPAEGERLVVSHRLQHVRFDAPGTVTAGSGVVLWTLQDMLGKVGFALPMFNDGYPGPTVGGYIAAGGIGPGSAKHGGFWNNVTSIRIVDGQGVLRQIDATDEDFNWLFGSMGQLGYIVEVSLKIIPSAMSSQPRYVTGHQFRAPFLDKPVVPPELQLEENQGLFWFTLVCPINNIESAHASLQQLEAGYAGVLRFQERYNYPIKYLGNETPPLFHSHQDDLIATGAWGWLLDIRPDGVNRLIEFDNAFSALIAEQPDYRRYIQSELPNQPNDYRRCFGETIYTEFQRVKKRWDPQGIFNPGSVFREFKERSG